MTSFPTSLWLIGAGNMAGSMLRRWLDIGLDPATVTVIRPSGAPVAPGVRVLTEIPAGSRPRMLLLGVKPQKLDDVAAEVAAALGPDTLLVSILAGVSEESLAARFPGPIVRAMPNTPVAIGKGATGLFTTSAGDEDRTLAEGLMRTLGAAEWIADESLFDAVAALAASGPAFVFRYIDALAKAAEAEGLPADQSLRLAIATVEGAGALAAASAESPHMLAERVASPGGMTRKGLDVLDADGALDALVTKTINAAVRRSQEMGEAAKRG